MRAWGAVILVVVMLGVAGAALGGRFAGADVAKPFGDTPARTLPEKTFGNGPTQT